MVTQHKNIALVLLPRFNMMTLTTMIEPMRIANYLAPEKLYSWDYRADQAGRVYASNGLDIDCAQVNSKEEPHYDVVIVFGSWGAENHQNPALANWLRLQARKGVLMVGVELGVYALARAGLLADKQVTTHWSCKQGLIESFPNINVCEQLFTRDGNIMSCAGGTAGIDMMLELIAQFNGEQLAVEVSNQLLHYPRRPAADSQRFSTGSMAIDIHPNVRKAMHALEANIEEPVSIPQLCAELGVSQRSLERLFVRDTGCTIVQFSKLLRLQYARILLTSTDMSVREVSVACGFNSLSYFSQCFSNMFSKRPSEYRQAWPENEPAPSWPGTVYSFIHSIKKPETNRANL